MHFNLSNTGLTEGMLQVIGTSLRRARSLLVLHLSGNPGITDELKEYLQNRVHCKPIIPKVKCDFEDKEKSTIFNVCTYSLNNFIGFKNWENWRRCEA